MTQMDVRGEGPRVEAWRRSAALGLSPDTAGPESSGREASRARRLMAAAEPVMAAADDALRDAKAMLVLADRSARMVVSAADDSRVSAMLRRRGIEEGADLSEERCGNNGIGTALETGRSVRLEGEEHFAETFHAFACLGLPVVNPLTRRTVGALDLSFLREDSDRFALPLLRQIAASIGARYVETAPVADRELYHRFLEAGRGSAGMTCAFGEEAVLVSRRGLDVLSSVDLAALRDAAESGDCPDRMELSIGEVAVSATAVGRSGRLVSVDLVDDRCAAARPATLAPLAPSASLAVVGPAGSGRTTAALAEAGVGCSHVRIAEADDSASAWTQRVAPALRASGSGDAAPVVLDDIDLLDDADLRRLSARLRSARGRIVLTTRDDARPAVRAVLERCGHSTRIAPLAERGEERLAIVRSLVAGICADKGIAAPVVTERFAAEACALDLPNELVSLRAVLAECLDPAPRLLEPACLPASARVSRVPRAGELARGEYEAIVRALEDCGGVRSRAARRLGISRTTLYARLREFGLD